MYTLNMLSCPFFLFSDDIDLEDPVEKPKEQSMLGSLNKQKLASTFNSFKGQCSSILNKKNLLLMHFS